MTLLGKTMPASENSIMQKWRIGDVTVTKIVELEATGGLGFILPQATREAVAGMRWMYPHFMDENGRVKASVHALVVETPSRRIIVDTCIGNHKQGRPVPTWNHRHGPFLDDLEAAGFAIDSIDTVLCTHLHIDHVGWNTMFVDDAWVPTFRRAQYLIVQPELEYWRAQREIPWQVTAFEDSVAPVLDAGLADFIGVDHRVCDEVSFEPTLGHTPGHTSIRIRSKGEEALITGDFLHHPCQLACPDWASATDYDKEQSTRTRRDMFEALAGTPTLVIGTHFAGPTAGRVERDGGGYRLAV